ncbi:hypothetical protein [Halioxenophilus sp. WMMB6]|uniref:hypothetical protein n=1 Tax=Halioxenophilus sp. WMMB6 TaxID=3073815 RepID=UPI00295ED310|nr:hypothetical protein [Halioxenophilus sp. WMMB6]
MPLKKLSLIIALTAAMLCGCHSESSGLSAAPSATKESPPLAAAMAAEKMIEVYISNGAVQCEFKGKPPAATAQLLTGQGIPVARSRCGVINGVAYPMVCGAGTGNINIHTIAANHLAAAKVLGFTEVSTLPEGYSENCN